MPSAIQATKYAFDITPCGLSYLLKSWEIMFIDFLS